MNTKKDTKQAHPPCQGGSSSPSCGCGGQGGSTGFEGLEAYFPSLFEREEESSCGGGPACSCNSQPATSLSSEPVPAFGDGGSKLVNRREVLRHFLTAAVATTAVATGCSSEQGKLSWDEYFKKNYRLMTDDEKLATVSRLQRLAEHRHGKRPTIGTKAAVPGVLYGYAFNVSKCKGYMDCVQACIKENNLDRKSEMQYIRIFEMKKNKMNLEDGNGQFAHQVPAAGHFYMGTQCFQCQNPPCVKVCPVGATWMEPDGIVVIDYDWCIGCRYCQSACPYWARRFNWHEPEVPKQEINPKQHYLGNRPRKKGVMEKCTYCIQRSREGQLPACAEACPTGARVFGNLLDPNSEIRYVLAHKKVFRLKEDLGTEPKFWYFMD
ncbi:MAG: 4Fe-4S dicluster domain-containing protein [Deltaproteobacteria bacterium]|nr:MAG: 4Fe-4S dicluster domain-containing protein [Deltaproteobacteria bacterium]